MVKFNKAGLDDLLKIQKIAYETWPNTFGQIISKEQLNYMLYLIYNKDSLKEQIIHKGHNFILAEEDIHSLGFTSYEIFFNSEPVLMIHKIYILPSAQGFGIGTKFLNLLSEIAIQNSNNQLRLKVYFKNYKAINFYEKYGFKNVRSEITDFGNNYAILDNIMIKELTT
jgi:GNAT superfamily N-acetyltransferase